MDIQALTQFLLCCTLINAGILILWTVFFAFAPDLVYRTQRRFFPISRENFNVIMYSFLGLFKILVLIFCLVPYLALRIMG